MGHCLLRAKTNPGPAPPLPHSGRNYPAPTPRQLCCRRLGRLYFSGVKKRNTVGWQMAVCGLVQFEGPQPEAQLCWAAFWAGQPPGPPHLNPAGYRWDALLLTMADSTYHGDKHIEAHTHKHTNTHTYMETHSDTHTETYIHIHRHALTQRDPQTYTQTHRPQGISLGGPALGFGVIGGQGGSRATSVGEE